MVSIITVNFRQAAVTCALLDSIRSTNQYADIEVIVVDNGSESDQTALFQQHYPGAVVLVSPENLGFAGGNNLGIQVAKGDFLFFVNNDTEWTSDLLENLLKRFEKSPKTGIVSPKIRYFNDPQRIQYAGFTKVNPWTGRNRAIGKNEVDRGQHDTATLTAYAHGAAMLVCRPALEAAGLMPEDFFLYYEELDWCARIHKAGFEIWYEPASMILHKESAAVGQLSPLKVFYQTRNRLVFMRKNNPALIFACFLTFFLVATSPVNSVRFLLKNQRTLLAAFWRGFLAGCTYRLPSPDPQANILAHERNRFYRISRLSRSQIWL